MQWLGRVLPALRGASAAPLAASLRTFSSAAAAEGAAAGGESWGAKDKLFKILGQAGQPLTSNELWEKAQVEGIKSKRQMKLMLQQMKEAGYVKTQRPMRSKRVKAFVYTLPKQSGAAGGKA